MSDGGEVDLINSTDMVREIQTVTEQRFSLAESAPATNTSLRDTVGFLADTEYALELVTGQAPLPADIDGPTKVIIEEMQRLWKDTGDDRFTTFRITQDDFRYYWRRAKEQTSSSYSNIHFGHYKAAVQSDLVSKFLADKLRAGGAWDCR